VTPARGIVAFGHLDLSASRKRGVPRIQPSAPAFVAPLETEPGPKPAPLQSNQPQTTSQASATTPVKDARANKLTPAGLVDDVAPVLGVYIHPLASELAPAFVQVLQAKLPGKVATLPIGYDGPQSGYSKDPNLVWLRDYLPGWVRNAQGELAAVKAQSPNATRESTTLTTWVPVHPPKPGQRLFAAPGSTTGGRWLESKTMPLFHENGNLVAAGAYALATTKLLEDNPSKDRAAVTSEFAAAIGTPKSHVLFLDKMPGEKTGHVDLFAQSLGANEVMIPEIRAEAMAAITMGHELALGEAVRAHLDKQAGLLTACGLKVTRLPMMPPVYLEQDSAQPTGWNGVFYSPANALLVNEGTRKFAFVPSFKPEGFPPAYQALVKQYEGEWKREYEKRGFETEVIDATRCGRAYGLFRCLTATQPA
jgi:hypothetical protein